MVDLDLEEELDGLLLAKLSTESWELNIRATADEFTALSGIRGAEWAGTGSIRVGSVSGVPAFWSLTEGTVSILLGTDDETWDVSISVPIEVAEELARRCVEWAG